MRERRAITERTGLTPKSGLGKWAATQTLQTRLKLPPRRCVSGLTQPLGDLLGKQAGETIISFRTQMHVFEEQIRARRPVGFRAPQVPIRIN